MSKQNSLKQKHHSQQDLIPTKQHRFLPVSAEVIPDLPVTIENKIDIAISKANKTKNSKLAKAQVNYSTSQVNKTLDLKDSFIVNKVSKIELDLEANPFTINSLANKLPRPLSPAEEKLFQELWRLTIGSNQKSWRGKIVDLMIRTGYSARATVTRAIAGLSALGLILVEGQDTSPKGRSYQVTEYSKTLSSKSFSTELIENNPTKKPPPIDPIVKNKLKKENSPNLYSASDNNEKFSQIRLIYQDLTNNRWSAKDDISCQEIVKIPLPFIILGICYKVTKSHKHQVESLKSCIPFIEEHYKLMGLFASQDLLEIAYKQLMLVKESQRTNKWPK